MRGLQSDAWADRKIMTPLPAVFHGLQNDIKGPGSDWTPAERHHQQPVAVTESREETTWVQHIRNDVVRNNCPHFGIVSHHGNFFCSSSKSIFYNTVNLFERKRIYCLGFGMCSKGFIQMFWKSFTYLNIILHSKFIV